MHDLLAKFFETPSATRYLAVQAALRCEPSLQSFSFDIADVAELMAAGEYAAVRHRIAAMMPGAALSPKIHAWSAIAAIELGDREDAELERFQYQGCLQGLQATGDGSASRPYQATYSSDAHDLLESRGVRVRRQKLLEKGSRRFDVITCDDRTTVWFDVTDMVVGRPQMIATRPVPVVRARKKKAVMGASRSSPARKSPGRRTR